MSFDAAMLAAAYAALSQTRPGFKELSLAQADAMAAALLTDFTADHTADGRLTPEALTRYARVWVLRQPQPEQRPGWMRWLRWLRRGRLVNG